MISFLLFLRLLSKKNWFDYPQQKNVMGVAAVRKDYHLFTLKYFLYTTPHLEVKA